MKNWLLIIIFFTHVHLLANEEMTITMSATPNPATMNSQIVLEVTMEGSSRGLPDIPEPELSNFKIIAGPSTSTSFNMINFETTVSKTLTYYLLPMKMGKFNIPPITVDYKGKKVLCIESFNTTKINCPFEFEFMKGKYYKINDIIENTILSNIVHMDYDGKIIPLWEEYFLNLFSFEK